MQMKIYLCAGSVEILCVGWHARGCRSADGIEDDAQAGGRGDPLPSFLHLEPLHGAGALGDDGAAAARGRRQKQLREDAQLPGHELRRRQ